MSRRKRMMEDLDQDIRDFIERETEDNIERGIAKAAVFAGVHKLATLQLAGGVRS